MKYSASIKSYDPDDELDKDFDTTEEAAEWLSRQSNYFGSCPSMHLNGVPVHFRDGKLVSMLDPEERTRLSEDFNRLFKPQSIRPINPATPSVLSQIGGKDE
jgi:hypothetical protein